MPIQRLPETGQFLVTTKQSSYIVDTDRKRSRRYRGEDAAESNYLLDRPVAYRHAYCEVGLPFEHYGVDGWWRRSTPVVAIHRINEDGEIVDD